MALCYLSLGQIWEGLEGGGLSPPHSIIVYFILLSYLVGIVSGINTLFLIRIFIEKYTAKVNNYLP